MSDHAESVSGELQDGHEGQEDFDVRDQVFPTVGTVDGTVEARVEQDRIRMRDSAETEVSLGVAHRSINPNGAVATAHARISEESEAYAEIAFETLDELKELRDALDAAIEYREGDDAGD